jgi:hypothetical protein
MQDTARNAALKLLFILVVSLVTGFLSDIAFYFGGAKQKNTASFECKITMTFALFLLC